MLKIALISFLKLSVFNVVLIRMQVYGHDTLIWNVGALVGLRLGSLRPTGGATPADEVVFV